MPRRLWVKSIRSVGAVDAGDDPEAVMTFWKRRTTEESGVDDRVETVMPEFSLADLPLSEEQAVALDEYIATVTKTAVDEAITPPVEEQVDDVFKNLDDAGKAALEELRKKADENAAALAGEIRKRRVAEFVAKTEPFKGLIGDDGAERIADLDDDTAGLIVGWLETAQEQIDKGALFKSAGAGEPGDVETEKAAFVKQYRQDHPDAPLAVASAEFWKLNPDAVERSREGK